jgi:flavin reductase (DIM6/NTAB) family NADH-FMN oxidoreductase RutF
MPQPDLTPLARALGRIPSGLYIVTTRVGGRPSGFLGSFVMQMGFAPPIVAVAIGKERPHLPEIHASGRFALSILDAGSRPLIGSFLKRLPEGESPFDGIALLEAPSGAPVLADALAWLDCAVRGEHVLPDHVVVFGEVQAGALLREADPSVHLRKNGLGY